MNLFEFDKVTFIVKPTEEALLLKPFSDIWKRDKTKNKSIALKEIGFVWFYCDVKSPFLILPVKERTLEIKKDLELPKEWKKDKIVDAAIEYYNSYKTQIERLFEGALTVANTITDICLNSKDYITSSDDKIAASQKLNSLLKELPTSMQKLKDAEKQYLKESDEKSGTKKGSQTFNTFEEGL